MLAELARRELVPEIWLPTPGVRAERERARFRLHLVRHRTALKNRIHATLMTFGHPVPVTDLFGAAGRELLERLALPEPWAPAGDEPAHGRPARPTDRRLHGDLRALGADHPSIPLLLTVPGSAGSWPTPSRRRSATSAASRVPRSSPATPACAPSSDSRATATVRGPLAKNGPKYLRWALIEAATHAARDPRYRERYERTKQRLGRQRGAKVARVDLARQLSEAIWHVLTKHEPFAPAGPAISLVA